MKYCLANQRSA